jgi:hypothetical protein
MSAVAILRDQLRGCEVHIEAARLWLRGAIMAKGFEPGEVFADRDRDGWKIRLDVTEGRPFRGYDGDMRDWHYARAASLSEAFAAAAAVIDAVVARNAYDADFITRQSQAATTNSDDAGGAPDAAPIGRDAGNGTVAAFASEARP